mmetsp:Transcript_15654/g.51231  ORF Transcript_15654/g.51231 Transcript_15654/m.51231 type:complete len:200 (+) Transcript_15654:2965-3564(+)
MAEETLLERDDETDDDDDRPPPPPEEKSRQPRTSVPPSAEPRGPPSTDGANKKTNKHLHPHLITRPASIHPPILLCLPPPSHIATSPSKVTLLLHLLRLAFFPSFFLRAFLSSQQQQQQQQQQHVLCLESESNRASSPAPDKQAKKIHQPCFGIAPSTVCFFPLCLLPPSNERASPLPCDFVDSHAKKKSQSTFEKQQK